MFCSSSSSSSTIQNIFLRFIRFMTCDKPILKFELSKPNLKNFGCIFIGDDVLLRIDHVEQFHNFLGYTKDVRRSEKMFDEFIWEEYTRDNANKCSAALQARLAEYLKLHCADFIVKYPIFA